MRTPEQAAQAQLDAYNARDAEAFASCYATDVVLSRLPSGQLIAESREALRESYAKMFAAAPELHCKLLHRMVHGRCVVDHEEVTGMPSRELVNAVAIYEVEEGLIHRVWFLEE